MAIMTCNYYSSTLKNTITLNVFIPTPEGNEQITDDKVKKQYHYKEGLPVVYLLHGAYGNYSSWLRFSNVERYAQEHCCALVMASAENSFYQNMFYGNAYAAFFSQELPAFIKSVFPVSDKRADTYIAGFSMGGYGAWYLALSNPDMYCKAASMSGALDIVKLYQDSINNKINAPIMWNSLFENPGNLEGSQSDLIRLYNDCVKAGTIPELYQSCGREDFLYEMNLSIKARLEQMNAQLVYKEEVGGHTWDFWDRDIKNVLDWIFSS